MQKEKLFSNILKPHKLKPLYIYCFLVFLFNFGAQAQEWEKEIDHIDGNPKNNKKTNLQVLCANCHRLKTFKQIYM